MYNILLFLRNSEQRRAFRTLICETGKSIEYAPTRELYSAILSGNWIAALTLLDGLLNIPQQAIVLLYQQIVAELITAGHYSAATAVARITQTPMDTCQTEKKALLSAFNLEHLSEEDTQGHQFHLVNSQASSTNFDPIANYIQSNDNRSNNLSLNDHSEDIKSNDNRSNGDQSNENRSNDIQSNDNRPNNLSLNNRLNDIQSNDNRPNNIQSKDNHSNNLSLNDHSTEPKLDDHSLNSHQSNNIKKTIGSILRFEHTAKPICATICGNKIIFGCLDGAVDSYDLKTLHSEEPIFVSTTKHRSIRALITNNKGDLLVGDSEGNIYRLIYPNRSVQLLTCAGSAITTFYRSNDICFCLTIEGSAIMFDEISGRIKQRFQPSGVTSAIMIDNTVIMADKEEECLKIYESHDGWSRIVKKLTLPPLSKNSLKLILAGEESPKDDILFVGSDSSATFYRLKVSNGQIISRYTASGQIAHLGILNNKIYAAVKGGSIEIFDVDSAKLIDKVATPAVTIDTLVVSKDIIYVGYGNAAFLFAPERASASK